MHPAAQSKPKVSNMEHTQLSWGDTDPVLNRNGHKAIFVRIDDLGHVLCTVKQAVASGVNPDHDRNRLVLAENWSVDVEE
jgi:hypothetical protein